MLRKVPHRILPTLNVALTNEPLGSFWILAKLAMHDLVDLEDLFCGVLDHICETIFVEDKSPSTSADVLTFKRLSVNDARATVLHQRQAYVIYVRPLDQLQFIV